MGGRGGTIITIGGFTPDCIPQAKQIARINYEEERRQVSILPPVEEPPDFGPFVENKLGVAAFEGDTMLGYLCCFSPRNHRFNSTKAAGVWSPIQGNGIAGKANQQVYPRMYQAAAKKWVNAGAASHSISFYAHNKAPREQLYRYGFGLRCIDAIRPMEKIDAAASPDYEFAEITNGDYADILPLNKLLAQHLADSPMFMRYPQADDAELKKRIAQPSLRYFTAKKESKTIAYINISDTGENFVSETPGMKNISGAYCLPEYRGRGIMQNLLNYLIVKLKSEKYTRLGVDFESFNPAGTGFWLKYFVEYTQSVVRRIDDRFI